MYYEDSELDEVAGDDEGDDSKKPLDDEDKDEDESDGDDLSMPEEEF